jgi:hypothetical protein
VTLEVFTVRRKARVQLSADQDCKKCDGCGVRVFTEFSELFGRIEVSVKLCPCVKAEFVGKPPRLPRTPMNVELIGGVVEKA